MKLSLSQRILNYYRNQPGVWIAGAEIERKALGLGYKASNASRRLRELHEDGKLAREMKGKHAWYCYEPQPRQVRRVEIINGRAVERLVTESV